MRKKSKLTDEWTLDQMLEILNQYATEDATMSVAREALRQLAAEREESAKWRSEASKTNELRQQLADEREKLEVAIKALKPFAQLAAELLTNRTQLGVSSEDDLINAASALAKIGEKWT